MLQNLKAQCLTDFICSLENYFLFKKMMALHCNVESLITGVRLSGELRRVES